MVKTLTTTMRLKRLKRIRSIQRRLQLGKEIMMNRKVLTALIKFSRT